MINQVVCSIGVDISKDSFHSCIMTGDKSLKNILATNKFSNSRKGFKSFFIWLKKFKIDISTSLIVMEATGVYWENLALFAHEEMKTKVSVINPKKIKHFAHTNLRRSKTDPLDASLISHFGLVMNPDVWTPFDPLIREIKQILRERDSFMKMITEEKNRLSAIEDSITQSKETIKAHKKTITFLQKQVEELEKLLEEKIKSDPNVSSKIDLLKEIPSVGKILSSVIVAETNNLQGFNSAKQLASYVGISPCQNQSGNITKKTKISKVGNAHIRKNLYMSALSGIRCNPLLKVFYIRLKKKGKPSKSALVAVARKLLHIIFAILKSGVSFDPNHISKNPALAS